MNRGKLDSSSTRRQFEREFLIRLAPVWLACRWKVMGHPLGGWPYKTDLALDLLGCVDYGHEMRLMCREKFSELKRATR